MSPLALAVVVAMQPPAPATPPRTPLDDNRPIGGYWAPGERPQPEPKDGYWNIVVGSVLVPLGALGTVGAAVGAYVTAPSRCEQRTGLSPDSCKGYFIFSLVRVGYSTLMLASGAALLGIGLSQRKKHREWKHKRNFTLAPWATPRAGGVGFSLTF